MHPILARRSRLALYLALWVLLGAVVVFVLVRTGALGWAEGAAVTMPLVTAYAFACLATWYLCRALPLGKTGMGSLVLSLGAATAVLSGLWTITAMGLAELYSRAGWFEGLARRLDQASPVVGGAGALLALLAISAHYAVLGAEASHEAERREAEARALARDAELRALRAQINPHFLFNSLNSISALVGQEPEQARSMCALLADFFRGTLRLGERSTVALEEEVALVRGYLAIEQVRFGSRLRAREEIAPECARCAAPPLILQPLVENAVKHGVSNLLEGGEIRIEAERRGAMVRIAVVNDFDPETPPGAGAGLGLENVRERLRARYREEARLETSRRDGRFRAEMWLPWEEAR